MRPCIRSIVFVVLFIWGSTSSAQTRISVENLTTVKSDTMLVSQINVYATGSGRIAPYIWSLTSNKWAEAIVGLNYRPVPSIEIGGGIGLESDNHPLRSQVQFFGINGRYSVYLAGEQGGSGWWYVAQPSYKISELFSLAVRAQRFAGIGPRIQLNKRGFSLWVVPTMRNPETSTWNRQLGFKATF